VESDRWPSAAHPLRAAEVAELVAGITGPGEGHVVRVMARPGERAAVVFDTRSGPAPPIAELVVEVHGEQRGPGRSR
jgi:hypothetical protein